MIQYTDTVLAIGRRGTSVNDLMMKYNYMNKQHDIHNPNHERQCQPLQMSIGYGENVI